MLPTHRKTRQSGFTLLELLLAIAISVMISAGGYQVVTSTASAITYVQAAENRLAPLQQLQWSLRQDLHSIVREVSRTTQAAELDIEMGTSAAPDLHIISPQQTSHLHWDEGFVRYSDKPLPGRLSKTSHETVYRSVSRQDRSGRDGVDAFFFEGISLLALDASEGDGSTNKPSASDRRGPSSHHKTTTIAVVVNDDSLGDVELDFGVW